MEFIHLNFLEIFKMQKILCSWNRKVLFVETFNVRKNSQRLKYDRVPISRLRMAYKKLMHLNVLVQEEIS